MYTKLSHHSNLGHEAFVMGIVDGSGKGQQQTGHQEENRHKAEHYCLCQHNPHIVTDPKLHKHHGYHAGYGGQGAGRDLRNGFAQRHNNCLSGILIFMLLHKTVAEDNGIIHRQRKLKHHRNGIGDKADGSEPIVCTFI